MAKVLIVDDDSQFLRALRIALIARGHEVCEAANGQEALARIGTRNVEVILIDWRMPVMDGEATCRVISAVAGIPVIVVSGLNCEKEAISAGASAFLRKPVDAAALLLRIEAFAGAVKPRPPLAGRRG